MQITAALPASWHSKWDVFSPNSDLMFTFFEWIVCSRFATTNLPTIVYIVVNVNVSNLKGAIHGVFEVRFSTINFGFKHHKSIEVRGIQKCKVQKSIFQKSKGSWATFRRFWMDTNGYFPCNIAPGWLEEDPFGMYRIFRTVGRVPHPVFGSRELPQKNHSPILGSSLMGSIFCEKTHQDGQKLAEWLTFDPQAKEFHGTPSQGGRRRKKGVVKDESREGGMSMKMKICREWCEWYM